MRLRSISRYRQSCLSALGCSLRFRECMTNKPRTKISLLACDHTTCTNIPIIASRLQFFFRFPSSSPTQTPSQKRRSKSTPISEDRHLGMLVQIRSKTIIENRMASSTRSNSVEFRNSSSTATTSRDCDGGSANSTGEAAGSCQDSDSKNLPMHQSGSRTNSSCSAQNSVAQNTKYDLPCQRHQQTELPEEQMRPSVPAVTRTNQRISPRIRNIQPQSPKQSMTLQPSQKRFLNAANGHKKNNYKHQQHLDSIRIQSRDLFTIITPTEEESSSSITEETTMQKEQHHDPVPTMEPEIDTRDTTSSGASTLPLHRMLEVESQEEVEERLAQIAAAERILGTTSHHNRGALALKHRSQVPSQKHDTSAALASPTASSPPRSQTERISVVKRKSSRKHKKLTLSAYRKPEETVRLTECDASRLLENEYNLRAPGCKVIGHGAFSTVRSALRNNDGVKVAIKSISKFDALRARRLRRPKGSKHMDEWEIMKLLRHNPYVLTLYDVFETDEEIHLVTEFCRGGELFDAIKRKSTQRSSFRRGRFSESQAARITNQILKALVELHDLGVVHRDIKAENILLLNSDESDMQVKLCDFGMARLHQRCAQHPQQHQQTASRLEIPSDGEASPSTPGLLFGYSVNAPPEGCHGNCIGPSTDIFSLGATLYILLCGFPPVFCDNVVEFPEAYWDDISEEAKFIVRSMLHHDPQQRISAKDALQNAWIKQETTTTAIHHKFRRPSISANLELVRARLLRSLPSSPTSAVAGGSKRSRYTADTGSSMTSTSSTSPKKRPRISSLDLSLNALYNCSEKRDVRVIEERVESRPIAGEERGQGMTCS